MSSPDRPPGKIYIIAAIAVAIVISIIMGSPGSHPANGPAAVAGSEGKDSGSLPPFLRGDGRDEGLESQEQRGLAESSPHPPRMTAATSPRKR